MLVFSAGQVAQEWSFFHRRRSGKLPNNRRLFTTAVGQMNAAHSTRYAELLALL